MTKRKLTVRDLAKLAGQKVDVHYNLHQCRKDQAPKAGEACWAVRKDGKIIGYADRVALADVALRAQPKGLAKIKRNGQRAVVAWATGTVAGPVGCQPPRPLTVDPFRDKSFVVVERGRRRPVKQAQRALFTGRKAQACGKVR